MHYNPIYGQEAIYIAGPECFYTNGYTHWNALGMRAKMMGFRVTMPSDNEAKPGSGDKQKDADAIFQNCEACINQSTAIIADLEFYRGADVDGGSIYEMGMAYANGCRCYGYTRDLRDMRFKYQGVQLKDGKAYDRKGRELPYGDLPFAPNIVGACKLIEGDFDDALTALMLDINEDRKKNTYPREKNCLVSVKSSAGKPVIYLAGPERYDKEAAKAYEEMKALCDEQGLRAVTPLDFDEDLLLPETADVYTRAYHTLLNNVRHVQRCDILLANLNDFHSWEPDADTSFECGVANQLKKSMYGYMENNCRMIDRIPHFGAEKEFRDHCGYNVENFDYPINLMFASSMPVFGGDFRSVLGQVVQDLKKKGIL